MRDPYSVLGVQKSASEKDIKSAYRKLAKAHHPDQNPNDPTAHAKFAEATAAYDLLNDKEKRARFDRGEIDADGNPRFGDFGGFGAGAARGTRPGQAGFSPEDILKEFMSGFSGQPRGSQGRGPSAGAGAQWDPFAGGQRGQGFGGQGFGGQGFGGGTQRGEDFLATATVTLEEAHAAGSISVRMPTGKTLSVKLPANVDDGQQVRLKGQGQPSPFGEPGDALITIRLARHKTFRRDGTDLRTDLPLTLYEAVLGAKVRVPTLDGSVELNLPPGVETGKSLRLKGKGLHGTGDLYVNLRIVLPKGGDPDLESLMRFWRDQKPYGVRD